MKLLSIVFVIMAFAMHSFQTMGQDVESAKTNFLFIIVDDLRPQIACYGHAETLSPNIDKLANEEN